MFLRWVIIGCVVCLLREIMCGDVVGLFIEHMFVLRAFMVVLRVFGFWCGVFSEGVLIGVFSRW